MKNVLCFESSYNIRMLRYDGYFDTVYSYELIKMLRNTLYGIVVRSEPDD